jgi:hypothetical protein
MGMSKKVMTLTGQNDRVDFVVFSQLPDEQLGEVVRVDELPERLAGACYDEGGVVFYYGKRLG